MTERISRRGALYGIAGLLAGAVIGTVMVGPLSAAPGPPGHEGLKVVEQNLGADGNIKVHEQGVVPVTDNGGSLTVDGAVSVSNLPSPPAPRFGTFDFDTRDGTSGTIDLEVPAGVLVTDIVVRQRIGECVVFVLAGGDTLIWGAPAEDFRLSLSSGIPGPLTISAWTSGTPWCSGVMFWTGVTAP